MHAFIIIIIIIHCVVIDPNGVHERQSAPC